METANSKLKELRNTWGIETWDKTYLRYSYRWARHVARYADYDVTKWAYDALTHKDWQFHKLNMPKYCSQLHGKRVHVFRWEAVFYKSVSFALGSPLALGMIQILFNTYNLHGESISVQT